MAFTDRLHNRGSISSGYDVSNSLKLEIDNTERLNFTYPSTGNRNKQTVSCWVKRIKPGSAECIWETASADGHEQRMFLRFQTDNTLRLSTATSVIRNTNRKFEDTAAWYHIVVAWDTTQATGSNRFKFYINGVEETSFSTSANMNQNQNTGAGIGEFSLGYSHIDSSAYCRCYVAQVASLNGQYLDASYFGEETADGEWIPKNLSSLTYGDRDFWLEFDRIGYGTSHRYWKYQAHSTTNHVPRASRIYLIKEDGSTQNFKYYAADNCSDQGGIMAVASGSTTYSDDSNTEYTIDLGSAQNVQGYGFYGSYGAASRNVTAKLYYSDNGSSWTEDQSNSISTNGCGEYNRYRGASGLGADSSGEGHNFSLTNITEIDQSSDTPTNNFCIMNNNSRTNGNIHSEHGGTYISTDGGSGWCSMNATMGVSNGKWYWESQRENNSDGTYVMIGIAGANDPWIPHRSGGYYTGNVATGASLGLYYLNGNIYNDASYPDINGASQGDILGVALDMDNLRLYYSVNGTWQTGTGSSQMDPAGGNYGINITGAFAGVSGGTDIILPCISVYQGNRTRVNFGGYWRLNSALASPQSDANGYGNFEYAPPSGYYALCTKNLAEYG